MNVRIQKRQLLVRGATEYLGPACQAEVVLAFLRAEIDSPRSQNRLLRQLQRIGTRRETLIDHANLAEEDENRVRALLLAATREPFFNRFPHDVVWWRCRMSLAEMKGHTRATAYVIARQPARVEAYIGTSDHMHQWWLLLTP